MKKLEDFLREHKPAAPAPHEGEALKIWEKIRLQAYVVHPGLSKELVFMSLVMIALTSFLVIKSLMIPQDLTSLSAVENSFDLEYEEDEITEITDLLALADEKGRE